MTPVPRVIRLQALTGLVFGTFLALHLVNAMIAGLGPGAYDGFQRAARRYYQAPLVEGLAIGVAGSTHVLLGAKRALGRRRERGASGRPGTPPRWLRLHRLCGWFLVVVIGGHFLATRGPGLWLDTPADLSYLTFSLTRWPAFMAPYYFLLFACGAFHLLHGAPVAANALGWHVPPPGRRWTSVALAGALVLGTVGILGMGGLLGEVPIPREARFRELYERFLPFLVNW